METIVVIGATGIVGSAIVAEMASAGFDVVAVSRSMPRLHSAASHWPQSDHIRLVEGDVSTAKGAKTLSSQLSEDQDLHAVIVAVNLPVQTGDPRVLEEIESGINNNLMPHIHTAQAFVPRLRPGASILSIGGGMADLVFPGLAVMSMAQAAQRMYFRHLAKATKDDPIRILELMIYSMIAPPAEAETADPVRIRATEVAAHVCAVLTRPDDFAGPILTLKSRDEVGQSQA